MIHEEKDYDITKIPADEPVFLLRGTDPFAPDLVREWAHRNRLFLSTEKMNSVCEHADKMEEYNNKFIDRDGGCTS